MAGVNWFDTGGRDYGAFRPDYPSELAAHLADCAARTGCAVDVGCGTGQLTRHLARHFDRVVGLDPSDDQLRNALPHPRITWRRAGAEDMGLDDGSADLITAAQAAHWFDLPAFYAQVRRAAAPGAVIALVSYGVMELDDAALDARFRRFYDHEAGPFWPPERRLVDDGYAGLYFPFAEIPAPDLSIRRDWRLDEVLGYVATWSSVRRLREAGRQEVLAGFAADLAALWGDPDRPRGVAWPVAMRLGRL